MSTEIPNAAAPGREKSDIRLVSRISDVLRCLSEQNEGMSLGQIAKASGIPRGTVQRLVEALVIEGLVARGSGDGSIRLGQEIARLGMTMNQDLQKVFRPLLQDLRDRSGETVDLSILHPRGAAVLDQIASPQALRVVSRPGQILPLHATASGKAHLGQLPPARRAEHLSLPLAALTPQTLTSVPEVLAHIEGHPPGRPFVDREEYAEGICALGIDLSLAGLGPVAIAISMPAARFAEAEQRCADLLVALRQSLER